MRYRELSRSLSVAHKSNVLWAPIASRNRTDYTRKSFSLVDYTGHSWLLTSGRRCGGLVNKALPVPAKEGNVQNNLSQVFFFKEKTILAQQKGNPYLKNLWLSVLKYLTAWCIFFFFCFYSRKENVCLLPLCFVSLLFFPSPYGADDQWTQGFLPAVPSLLPRASAQPPTVARLQLSWDPGTRIPAEFAKIWIIGPTCRIKIKSIVPSISVSEGPVGDSEAWRRWNPFL